MKTENKVAKELIKNLRELGFIVHRYDAVTTNSIYLKLDYGVCCGIRIADHKGKQKYHYRFNVYKDYDGDRVVIRDNLISYFYTFNEIPQLLRRIHEERKLKIKKYGIDKYKRIMKMESEKNRLYRRFDKVV